MRKIILLSKNLFFIISFTILIGSIYFFVYFKNIVNQFEDKIHTLEVNRASKASKTIMPQIMRFTLNNSILNITDNLMLTNEIEHLLSYYRNDEFKYVYIVYVDKDGSFRYLADGSSKEERATIHQKFTPSLTSLWEKLFKEKRDVYDIQTNAEGLWLTYLSPILKNGKVEGVLVLDISTKEYQEFSKLLTPLGNLLNSFLIFLLIIFVVISFQGVLFYIHYRYSLIDSLTKLYNRNFLDRLPFKKSKHKMAIMMLDIDFFKSINDKYGHDVGDIVLASIAKKLLLATRLDDIVIRYGGEEFLIIVKSVNVKDFVVEMAERIKEEIAKNPIRINDDLQVSVTISIGLNLEVNSFDSLKDAIKKADEMLYLAKENGRNRVEVYKT